MNLIAVREYLHSYVVAGVDLDADERTLKLTYRKLALKFRK